MIAPPLTTRLSHLKLVAPDIDRDAPVSVGWLAGPAGRQTLELMGVPPAGNHASSLAVERKRVRDFIDRTNQLNWMMQLGDDIVGSIWVDLDANEGLEPPALHLMVGDSAYRQRGLGQAALTAVVEFLRNQGYTRLYSRHLVTNQASAKLLQSAGFKPAEETYSDVDGRLWQNVVKEL